MKPLLVEFYSFTKQFEFRRECICNKLSRLQFTHYQWP